MSDYSLVQRGTIAAVGPLGVAFLDDALGSAVKLSSAFVIGYVRSFRGRASVERGTRNLTNADSSPVDITITTVDDVDKAEVRISAKWFRPTNLNSHGVTARLLNPTTLRLEFAALAATETIDVEWEVSNTRGGSSDGTLRLLDANTVRMDWDGNLLAGDFVTGQYEVWDIENLGDDIKELLFRGQLVLGHLGENSIQDSIVLDDAGNMVSYRKRIFDSKANAELATPDIPDADALETGELSRVKVTQSIEQANNDRDLMTQVVLLKAPTPGVN